MSVLNYVKASLRGVEDEDDALLLRLIESASRECAHYIYGEVPEYEVVGAAKNPVNIPELLNGIVMVVVADYEGDPDRRMKSVEVAKRLWFTNRIDLAT